MGFEERMLLSAEEMAEKADVDDEVRVYSDCRMLGSRRPYGTFVKSLAKRGLVDFTLEPVGL